MERTKNLDEWIGKAGNTSERKEPLMVPDGMKLEDLYGISPITGKREPLFTILVDTKTGKEITPDREEVMNGWDPVIEVINAVDWDPLSETYEPADVMHIRLQKWIVQRKTEKKISQPINKEIQPILKALRAIAGDDQDFAQSENSIGFSGFDTEFGHSLASRDFLTEKQIPFARKLVYKYRKQLQHNYPAIWDEVKGELEQ